MQAAAQRVGARAQLQQLAALQQGQGFGVRETRARDGRGAHGATAAASGMRMTT